jgi:hypothetical protein
MLAAAGALLSACAGAGQQSAPPASPEPLSPAAREVPYFPEDAPDPVLPPGSNSNPIPLEKAPRTLTGTAAIAQANRDGRREVNSDGFDGVKYIFELGATETYPVRVPRDGETVIRFLPGENLDTWTKPKNDLFEVKETAAGDGASSSNVLVVRCVADKNDSRERRSGSFSAITDKREYPFELTCQTVGNKIIGFRHPVSGLESGKSPTERALDRDARARKFARVKESLLENMDCASYRFDGQIMNLPGKAMKACTDGYTTTIIFPSETAVGGAFPMPSVHPTGQQLPFQYIRKDNPVTGQRQWVVDKPIVSATMQHGTETITITRGP